MENDKNNCEKQAPENHSAGFGQLNDFVRADFDDLTNCFESVDSEARGLFTKIAKLLIEYREILYIDHIIVILELSIAFVRSIGIDNKSNR